MQTADSTARKQNCLSSTELARSECYTSTRSTCKTSVKAAFMTNVADRHSRVFSTSAPDAATDTPAKDEEGAAE